MREKRLTSQEALMLANQYEEKNKKGRLKIFFGYAAGVGKTYAMLKAGHEAQKAGIDVVVGYVEKHTRPDTLNLLDGLEQLPNKEIVYKSVTLTEFDIDGALARKPELILVDELAHSNASGSRHVKRYQDVEELLRAGIDVYSTVNVQHLESIHDLVASITGVSVSERIPDSVFDSAAQVELVDIEPDDLIKRLENGQIYKPGQAKRALNNFFTKSNLAALREIALRRTADRLNKTAKEQGNEYTARAGEHILACLSSAPSNAKVIRTAARMAEAFHSSFTALFVETPQTKELKGDNLKRLRDNLRLAEQLGAQISTVYGDDPAAQIAEYAKVSGVTKIVLGRSNHRRSKLWKTKSLVDKLTELASNIDIYIIPDQQPAYSERKHISKPFVGKLTLEDSLKTVASVAISTIIGFAFFNLGISEANIIMIYILVSLIVSVITEGPLYGVVASFLSVVAFNYFFTYPRFTLHANPEYPITFFIMLLTNLISGSLAMRVKKQARQSSQKAYYTELLMASNQKLQQGKDVSEILEICANQLTVLLNRPVLFALPDEKTGLVFDIVPKEKSECIKEYINDGEKGVAQWVYTNNKSAGANTNTFPHAQNYYLAVRGMQGVMAVVAIPAQNYPDLEAFEKNLLIAILNECGIIMERMKLREEKQNIEIETQQEKLRSNLLRAISHDLRTPLTSISGNASILMEKSESLQEERKQQFYQSIYDDSMWLINLTENLLSITRIENGKMRLQQTPELLEDVFQEAMEHVDKKIRDYKVSINVKDELLMARMDAKLIVQVIVNIVNNAVKYTPPGSSIKLDAHRHKEKVVVSISDNGPGISDEAKKHLFDMFYTAGKGSSDNRRGLGLGLNLCRSIIAAHGGDIKVTDNKPTGSIFTFTLPFEEVHLSDV